MSSMSVPQSNLNRTLARAYLILAPIALSFAVMMPSHSQADITAVDDLKTETTKVAGIYNDVLPVAIGSTVFGIGAILVKRIAFS